jgi:2-haloalkanoic acid dehalogenase type II
VAYKAFAASLNLPSPSEEEARDFGSSIGKWPAFPDTVPALQVLKKHYKLAILSNIDNDSIAATLSGPLAEVEFDAVYTAQNIGSYKPDPRNFTYLLEGVKRDLGVEKDSVLHTAQALIADMVPAKEFGLHGAWINREGEEQKLNELKGKVNFTWKFKTLGEMAEEVEKSFETGK